MSDTEDRAARLAAIRAANAAKAAAPTPTAAPGAVTTPTVVASAPVAPVVMTNDRAPYAVAEAARAAANREPLLDLDHLPPTMPFATLGMLLIGVAVGSFAAVVALPTWLPSLSESLLGGSPKAYWYLSRSSALVAYILTWLSMVLGLMLTSRAARLWPGGPVAFDLHQHASLLGLVLGLFHALILLGDNYIKTNLREILIPFTYGGYEPRWVGLGQVAFYLLAIVSLSFYLRPLLGRQAWRVIHFLSFLLFALALAHGLLSGTESSTSWAKAMYLSLIHI